MSQSEQDSPAPRGKRRSKRLEKKRELALVSEPFLDDAVMDGKPPTCTRASFKQPRLRRCPNSLDTTTFVGRVNSTVTSDGGLDGYNWKVRFGDEDAVFVLKMFWDTSAPELVDYYAAQRECENVALLEMIEAALSKAKSRKRPVLVRARPETREEAEANLFAFVDQARRKVRADSGSDELEPPPDMPRMRRCFGWMQFTGAELLQHLPRDLRPSPIQVDDVTRELDADATYTALVYEFVEEGGNDFDVVQRVLDFLWCFGFSWCPLTKAANWESSILLDYSDIVHLNGQGWNAKRFRNREADDILWA